MAGETQKTYPYVVSLIIMVLPYVLAFLTIETIYNWTDLIQVQHPLIKLLIVDVVHTILVFVFSFAFNNSSIYDPYWQTLPIGYAILLNSQTLYSTSFRNLMTIFPLLAYFIKQNIYYFRFWPGMEYEDFRYKQYSAKIQNRFLYWPFSFLSFHLFPTLLVYFGLTPLYYTLNLDISNQSLFSTTLTYLGSLFSLSGVIIEAFADEQLLPWRGIKTEKCIEVGLWKYSRHPNYFGQISIWWGIFIPILAMSQPPYWTILGAVAITALFNFYSIPAMEKHLLSKKASYKNYQLTVSRLIPWFRAERKTK